MGRKGNKCNWWYGPDVRPGLFMVIRSSTQTEKYISADGVCWGKEYIRGFTYRRIYRRCARSSELQCIKEVWRRKPCGPYCSAQHGKRTWSCSHRPYGNWPRRVWVWGLCVVECAGE